MAHRHGRRKGGAQNNKPVDTESLYKLLGVEKTASDAEIKKAYYKLARDLHPDKNNGETLEQFQAVSHAYDVLSDPAKRARYDRGEDENDIFGPGPTRPNKPDDIVVRLSVTLEELYNSAKKEALLKRVILCSGCEGKGSNNPNATRECRTCQGNGVVLVRLPMGFGMFQAQQECPDCGGSGEYIHPKNLCKKCKGDKVTQVAHKVSVEVDKGMPSGHRIRVYGEGNKLPGFDTGDVVVVLQEEPHEKFLRRASDLIYKTEITLVEALCGYTMTITHLDGRTLLVRSGPGEIIASDDIRAIPDEGMPTHRNPFIKGYLFVHYTIVWPEKGAITADHAKLLAQAFPSDVPAPIELPEEYEVAVPEAPHQQSLSDDEHHHHHHHHHDYDDDDDDDDDYGDPRDGPSCVHQ